MQDPMNDTIAAPITGNGNTAVGVIRISGKQSHEIAQKCFSKSLKGAKGYSLHYGHFLEGDNILDEVILALFKAPKSFTGENVVEISFHGSAFILAKAMEILGQHGARPAEPGEFTMRAYLNGQMDLSQAEAVADLISSQSSAAHKMAMYQLKGGYSEMIGDLKKRLIKFAALLELELDFAEEDVEFADREEFQKLIHEIIQVCTQLVDSFRQGNAIKNGIPVAIVGPPNAGKSTLLNRLLKENRAIVSEIAGTTRDTIEDEMVIAGHRFRFIDTAGIRETADEIEKLGIQRSLDSVRKARIVLWVHDLSRGVEAFSEAAIRKELAIDAKLIQLANKLDAHHSDTIDSRLLPISAKTGEGMEELEKELGDYAASLHADGSDMIVSNQRHVRALKDCIEHLNTASAGLKSGLSTDLVAFDLRRAMESLGAITGEITTDDLLGTIFSEFCIGK